MVLLFIYSDLASSPQLDPLPKGVGLKLTNSARTQKSAASPNVSVTLFMCSERTRNQVGFNNEVKKPSFICYSLCDELQLFGSLLL